MTISSSASEQFQQASLDTTSAPALKRNVRRTIPKQTSITMATQYAKDLPAGTSNHVRNIAIVGATGTIGKFITAELLKTGKHTVTGITREDSKSQMPEGVRAGKVNYDDPSTIVKALQGQDALIITMGTMAPKEQQLKLIEAAAEAKVPFVMPNEYSPDVTARPDMGNDALIGPAVYAAHDLVEKLGVSSWIGLTSGFWYQYSLIINHNAFGFDFKNKKATFSDDGLTKTNISTWPQSGRAVAALFSLPILPQDENDKQPCLSQWKNRECHISSFFISQRDMLDSVLRVTGDKESDWEIEYVPAKERYQQGMEMMQGADRFAGYVRCMYTRVFYKDGSGDFNDKLDNEKLGLPVESLDEATEEGMEMIRSGWTYH